MIYPPHPDLLPVGEGMLSFDNSRIFMKKVEKGDILIIALS
jgi:hypothetical protein